MTFVTDPPQTAKLPHMREWESLTIEQEGFEFLIVSFHSRIAKQEVESHVPNGWYCPPTWSRWNGLHGKPNPVYREDGLYVWLLLKRKGS